MTKTYEVLTSAPFVAGQRSPGFGRFLELTDEQARYPILSGHIRMPETEQTPLEAGAAAEEPTPVKPARRAKG